MDLVSLQGGLTALASVLGAGLLLGAVLNWLELGVIIMTGGRGDDRDGS